MRVLEFVAIWKKSTSQENKADQYGKVKEGKPKTGDDWMLIFPRSIQIQQQKEFYFKKG